MAAVRTRRWTRSPRGKIFGVVTGLAEWRGLPEDATRLVVLVIALFTAVAPVAVIYLLLALFLPEQTEDDIISSSEWRRENCSGRKQEHRYGRKHNAEDAVFRDKTDEDLEKEYENLKRKVESMENDIYDKEKDWDNRFNSN